MYFCTHRDDLIPSVGFRDGRLDASHVAQYWDRVEIGCYPKAFEAAKKCDYNEVAQLIPKLCLVTVRVLSLALSCFMYCIGAIGPSRQHSLRHTAPCCCWTCRGRVYCDCPCHIARGCPTTRAHFEHRSLDYPGPSNCAADTTAGTCSCVQSGHALRKMQEAFCSGRQVQDLPSGGVLLC